MKEKKIYKITLLTLLFCSYCGAQTSDFIVTTAHDTIYVDKVTVTDFGLKTKVAGNKKKYQVDEIISYYTVNKNEYYERIPVEKKEHKAPDKYDYQRNENFYLEQYKNNKQYKFIQRLTQGKVKLFCEVKILGGTGTAGQAGYLAPSEKRIYYIAIYDSKLEPITKESNIKLFDFNHGLTLNTAVYEVLKLYLYGNEDIDIKLDNLFNSKPIAKEKQIIDLINEYNLWVKSNK